MTLEKQADNQTDIYKTQWRAPSNIAIVKYWGKKGNQEPVNPSLSLTLRNSYTETLVLASPKTDEKEKEFKFSFNNKPLVAFETKLEKFFTEVFELYPELHGYTFQIESSNSFPHSAGIASSASAMAALAACIIDFKNLIRGKTNTVDTNELSSLARLGSGSASRSVISGWSVWGQHRDISNSSDSYAIPINNSVHESFLGFNDTILIISSGKKAVSSSKGHQLMENHPYKNARIEQANRNITRLLDVLKSGDLDEFCTIAEEEALSLHALMMSSNPGYFLMTENTMKAIEDIRRFRAETRIPVCFTLDAGPNIHLLYPESQKDQVSGFINNQLIKYCESKQYIDDQIGFGPEKLF